MKNNRSFENVLALMILGLCILLAQFAVIPNEIKLAYHLYFSICYGSSIMLLIMNIIYSIKKFNIKNTKKQKNESKNRF